MGRHRAISGFVRGGGIIKVVSFLKSFELFDDTVGIFGVIFRNLCFNTGSVK
jgi:hypothetical protein